MTGSFKINKLKKRVLKKAGFACGLRLRPAPAGCAASDRPRSEAHISHLQLRKRACYLFFLTNLNHQNLAALENGAARLAALARVEVEEGSHAAADGALAAALVTDQGLHLPAVGRGAVCVGAVRRVHQEPIVEVDALLLPRPGVCEFSGRIGEHVEGHVFNVCL